MDIREGSGKKVCQGCISVTIRCRKLILGREIRGALVQHYSVTLI